MQERLMSIYDDLTAAVQANHNLLASIDTNVKALVAAVAAGGPVNPAVQAAVDALKADLATYASDEAPA
jgi:hypothetical protein